jgi:chemotaxis protein CheD
VIQNGISAKVIGVGECIASANPAECLATYALGSCIAVAICDRAAQVGGLLHFLLPDASYEPARRRDNPYLCVDTGLPELLKLCIQLGARKSRLSVCAAGGASILHNGAFFNVGRKNQIGLERALAKAGLKLHAGAMGGQLSRAMRLDIGGGRFFVRKENQPEELLFAAL